MSDKLRVRLRKSPISYTAKARGTVRALGLHRMHETVEVPDNPATRGMVRAVRFLVEVEQVSETAPATAEVAPRPVRRRPASAPVDTGAPAKAAGVQGDSGADRSDVSSTGEAASEEVRA